MGLTVKELYETCQKLVQEGKGHYSVSVNDQHSEYIYNIIQSCEVIDETEDWNGTLIMDDYTE